MERFWKRKKIIFNLIKYRFLFDKYIVKRDCKDNNENVEPWSLQKLTSKGNENSCSNYYTQTFSNKEREVQDNNSVNKYLQLLQSCLRITYTSPKTMHWLTMSLTLINKKINDARLGELLLEHLEKYCCSKVFDAKIDDCSGFEIARIVFTYLDYVLYKYTVNEEYRKKINQQLKKEIKIPEELEKNLVGFAFIFRNSIEHFRPQSDPNIYDETKNNFGNLALITPSANSRFSNLDPVGKIEIADSDGKIVRQSPKLMVMKILLDKNNQKWGKTIIEQHGDMMKALLKADMALNNIDET